MTILLKRGIDTEVRDTVRLATLTPYRGLLPVLLPRDQRCCILAEDVHPILYLQACNRTAKEVAKWNNHAAQYEMAMVAAETVPFSPPTPTYYGPGYEYRYTPTSPAKPLGEAYP